MGMPDFVAAKLLDIFTQTEKALYRDCILSSVRKGGNRDSLLA
jgi:hypothetical protein